MSRAALRLRRVAGVALAAAAAWAAAYAVEERVVHAGAPIRRLAVRVTVTAPPRYEVTPRLLVPVVESVLRARAPEVALAPDAADHLDLAVSLAPMEDEPAGYQGWVRLSFHRARWVPVPGPRRPDWSDRILVFGVPPRLGSAPRDNVRGAVRIVAENFVAGALGAR